MNTSEFTSACPSVVPHLDRTGVIPLKIGMEKMLVFLTSYPKIVKKLALKEFFIEVL